MKNLATWRNCGGIDTHVINFYKQRWGLAAFIVVLTVLVYFPATRAGFVWDDDLLLTRNPLVQSSSGLWRMWRPSAEIDYYPVTWTSFWIEWRLWQENPTGYHIVNILLHALGALLLWQILDRLKMRGAWLAAVLFAVHPVNVESVAWVSERKNTLSLVFYALAVLTFLRAECENKAYKYWGGLGIFVLALLSKTTGVMLPLVLLLCTWWQRGVVTRRDLLRCTPFFLLAIVFGLLTIYSQQWQLPTTEVRAIVNRPILFRLGAAGHVFWFYLLKILVPIKLMTEYPLWKFSAITWRFWLPTISAVAAIVIAWRFRATWGRAVLFALLYFGAMLFPVLGIFNAPYIGRSPVVTDHLQYLAMIGILTLIAAGITRIPRPAVNAVIAVIVGSFCFLSWTRASHYENQEALFSDTLAKNPNAAKAHFELANALIKRGRLDAAVVHYKEAVRLAPMLKNARWNLASSLAKQGKYEEAIACFQENIRLWPNIPELHYNFAYE